MVESGKVAPNMSGPTPTKIRTKSGTDEVDEDGVGLEGVNIDLMAASHITRLPEEDESSVRSKPLTSGTELSNRCRVELSEFDGIKTTTAETAIPESNVTANDFADGRSR